MTRFPYITPTTEQVPVRFDAECCVVNTSTDPYEDNGDYDWNP